MLNELIGSVVQVVLFAAVPFLVWFLTTRKAGSKGTEGSKDTFFSWIGLKKPVCEDAGKTILLTVVATLLYIGATIFSILKNEFINSEGVIEQRYWITICN